MRVSFTPSHLDCAEEFSKKNSSSLQYFGGSPFFLRSSAAKGANNLDDNSECLGNSEVLLPICSPLRKRLSLRPASETNLPWQNIFPVSDSPLESLPLDVIVNIVCCLHHDELKSLLNVSKRLREAVMIAKENHFNFTTPGRKRILDLAVKGNNQSSPGDSEKDCPVTPRAARKLSRSLQPQMNDLESVAKILFEPSSLHQSRFTVQASSIPPAPKPRSRSQVLLF